MKARKHPIFRKNKEAVIFSNPPLKLNFYSLVWPILAQLKVDNDRDIFSKSEPKKPNRNLKAQLNKMGEDKINRPSNKLSTLRGNGPPNQELSNNFNSTFEK